MESNTSKCLNDDSFGPTVAGCRDEFDFTIVFEQSFFSIAPSVIFVFLAAIRIFSLRRKSPVLKAHNFRAVKLVTIAIYSLLQLTLLILACQRPIDIKTNIVAASLTFVNTLFFSALSILEHSKSLRSSALFNTYLFFSLLFDAVQSRTLWLAGKDAIFTRLFTAAIGVKAGILALESQGKQKWMPGEQRSPEETSGIFNMSLFGWLNDLVMNGYRKVLSIDDLYSLDAKLSAAPLQAKFSEHWKKSNVKMRLRLLQVTFRTLRWQYIAPIGPRLALIGFTFCQPFLINSILNYIQDPNHPSPNIGYGYIGAAAIVYIGIAISTGFYWYLHQRALTMTRACLVSALYQTTTSISITQLDNSAAVTLMSTDTQRIMSGFRDLHECWASFVETLIATWLLERQLGAACIAPIAVVIFCVIAAFGVGKFAGKRQGAWMENLQKRVGVTANAIANMTSLKISGLTGQMTSFIQALRTKELDSAKRFRLFNVTAAVIAFTPLLISPVLAFSASNRDLNTTSVFTSLSYLLLLTNPLTQLFQSIPQILAAMTCLKRIEKYLQSCCQLDTRKFLGNGNVDSNTTVSKGSSSEDSNSKIACTIKEGFFGWVSGETVLQNINLQIPKSQLTMIVGPVASGKSTLCKALLGETPVAKGDTIFWARFSQAAFCDQTSFLINATIRQNILGEGLFDSSWYEKIIESVALKQDLDELPDGDHSFVGTNGVTLSGGQRQRVALARSLYSRPDLAVFDDIFSGMDAKTEEQVFRKVFGQNGILRHLETTVILSTHSIKHLPVADHIITLSADHTVIEEGTFDVLVKNQSYIQSLGVNKQREPTDTDSLASTPCLNKPKPNVTAKEEEDKARQLGDVAIYRYYFSTIGITILTPFVLFGLAFAFLYNFPAVWLVFWARANERGETERGFYLGIYSMLQILCLVMLAFYTSYGGIFMAVKASFILHSRALGTVMNAPLAFFSAVDAGITTNRFSQDISMIDNDLSMALSNTLLTGFTVLGQAAVIASSSPYLVIGYPILVGLLYVIQKVYLRTSRQLRFLDLEAKAPLYTHFLETLKGLITLRAFGWLDLHIDINNKLLDASQRPMYLLAMLQQWLTLVLNMCVAVLAVILITLATQLRTNSGFTGVGLVTLMSFGQMLASLVQCWTQLETSTGALSRMKAFGEEVKSENLEQETWMPGEEWPSQGLIEFQCVSATYERFSEKVEEGKLSEGNLVLKDIQLSISSGEKIAVCGRTGSGKSSLILLLLRFLNPHYSTPNSILIDSKPLHLIHRPTLRSRIIAIPQTPFLLPESNTVRENLICSTTRGSPIQEDDYTHALKAVRLLQLVTEIGGLDAELKEGSLSQGQKQLFSLARAILRARLRSKSSSEVGGILLLDEINSSVDKETDEFMQGVIMREFKSYTVVYVTHKLDTVMDYDRLVVMDKGKIVEVGKPTELLMQEGGRFRSLWQVGSNSQKV